MIIKLYHSLNAVCIDEIESNPILSFVGTAPACWNIDIWYRDADKNSNVPKKKNVMHQPFYVVHQSTSNWITHLSANYASSVLLYPVVRIQYSYVYLLE